MENNCHIALVGLNHKTVAIEIRECIRFSDTDLEFALAELNEDIAVQEIVLLSTCNRLEFIMATVDSCGALRHIQDFLSVNKAFDSKEYESAFYLYTGNEAVRHLYRVASGLDSMLVGEPQILGQLKAAYKMAVNAGTTGLLLNKLLHRSFAVAKRIRNDTNIGAHAVSVSYAPVEIANRTFKSLQGKKVLLIGSGEMAELALSHFIRRGIEKTFVMNRIYADSERLAKRFNAEAIPDTALRYLLSVVDIVISSTTSEEPVIRKSLVTLAMKNRNGSPLLLVDMGLHRDVEPGGKSIEKAYVYDADDLKSIVLKNIDARNKAALKGEAMIDDAVTLYENWINSLDAVKTITDLRRKFHRITVEETEKCKTVMACLNAEDCAAVERLIGRIVKKILHNPIEYLRNRRHFEKAGGSLNSVRSMFRLDE